MESAMRIKIDTKELIETSKWLGNVAKQIPYATALALTRTAQKVQAREVGVMKVVFDRPTPFTLRSLYMTPAKKTNLEAEVGLKVPWLRKEHYLTAQIHGNTRRNKGFERKLGGLYLTPADEMKLDRYGNVPNSTLNRILSSLGRAETTAGYTANISARSALRGKARDFFFLKNARNGLLPGVYERIADSKKSAITGQKGARVNQKGVSRGGFHSVVRARGIRPLLIAGRKPDYQKRFPFYEEAQRVVDREFNGEFYKALDQAMRTAR
jgi:hypothetical protein